MPPRALAWQDGRVLPAADATVPLLDDGFLRGDAVFESVMVRGGRTHALGAHLDRMRASGRGLGLRIPVLRQVVTDLLAAWGDHDGVLKLVVTRGGTIRGILQASTWPDQLDLARVELPWRSAVSGLKTLSYAANMVAMRAAHEQHADDALVTDGGIVHELSIGAIAWVVEGRVRTPDPAALPILDSVTVRELAKVAEVEFGTWTFEEFLADAEEVFVLSATRPVLPVRSVDDREFPCPGPVTTELRRRFSEHIDASLD